MRATRVFAAAVLAVAGLVRGVSASAQGFYLGASAGNSNIDDDITTGLITSGTVDGKSSGYKLFGGYQFNDYFGLDLAYVDLGKAALQRILLRDPSCRRHGGSLGSQHGRGRHPAGESEICRVRQGWVCSRGKPRRKTLPWVCRSRMLRTGTDFSAGLGMSFHFTRNLSARVEWERFGLTGYDFDLGHVELLSLGMVYRF